MSEYGADGADSCPATIADLSCLSPRCLDASSGRTPIGTSSGHIADIVLPSNIAFTRFDEDRAAGSTAPTAATKRSAGRVTARPERLVLPSGPGTRIVGLRLQDLPAEQIWIAGRPQPDTPFLPGALAITHLVHPTVPYLGDIFDTVQIDLPEATSASIADTHGMRTPGSVQVSRGWSDPIFAQLGQVLLEVLKHPERASRLFLDTLTLAVHTHLLETYIAVPRQGTGRARGGLAPWQERRVKEMMAADLQFPVSLSELAAACGLSVSHFSRAFKQSTGDPPHRWAMQLRLSKAKEMLSNTAMSITAIAIACGFADQSHMNKVFRRVVGCSPRTWQRTYSA